MDNPKPETENAPRTKPSPGRLLRQARLDLRLAPEDVAQILHLSSKQIKALEVDDFEHLPGPTYIRGYLRSYAQLLGLAPEKVVEAYNSLMIPEKPPTPPPAAPPPQITSGSRQMQAVSAGVAFVVLGLAYLWWQSEAEREEPRSATGVISKADVVSQSQISDSEPKPGLSGPPAGAVVSETAPPAPASQEKPPEPPPAPGGKMTVSGLTVDVSPAAPPKATTSVPPSPERVTLRTRQAADIPEGVPRSRMILHAVQESWAEVRDARDNRLLYENVPAGRRISIEGVAPFNVYVGNADGVRVEFNGKNYDISRHKRGQVARFTLGEEKAVNN